MKATQLEDETIWTKDTSNGTKMKIANLVSPKNNVVDFYIVEHCDKITIKITT
jgi:uncharacterized protein YaiI (UPF0178 family)